ncbi:Cytochrome c oxidase subunit 5C [Spatholobus suberectus]|nr:Cytochrome c oxidase subunit 5C [Spatholobus suberectus]
MAGPRIAHATLKGPSVVKEICIGIVLGLAAGSVWKMHHWNEKRKTRTFYDLLERVLHQKRRRRRHLTGGHPRTFHLDWGVSTVLLTSLVNGLKDTV